MVVQVQEGVAAEHQHLAHLARGQSHLRDRFHALQKHHAQAVIIGRRIAVQLLLKILRLVRQ